VEPDADRLVRIEGEGPDVAVLAVELRAQQRNQRLGQQRGREGQHHVEQLRRLHESPEMIVRPEDEELGLLGVPVAADAAEDARAVVERVRHDADLRLGVRDDAAAEKSVAGKAHVRSPFRLFMTSLVQRVQPGLIRQASVRR
jgi:hypothetical protein